MERKFGPLENCFCIFFEFFSVRYAYHKSETSYFLCCNNSRNGNLPKNIHYIINDTQITDAYHTREILRFTDYKNAWSCRSGHQFYIRKPTSVLSFVEWCIAGMKWLRRISCRILDISGLIPWEGSEKSEYYSRMKGAVPLQDSWTGLKFEGAWWSSSRDIFLKTISSILQLLGMLAWQKFSWPKESSL